ncbi:hypothetical protein ABGB18_25370 [Nonomuraea sp. B12E4]|uniref:hypothetical protein n=1 Tax=Nonomuraea sp. B12E4 TaxID=3153564 RepID=UPI00325CC3F2
MMRVAERLRGSRTTGTGGFNRKLIAPMILGSVLNPINSSMLAIALFSRPPCVLTGSRTPSLIPSVRISPATVEGAAMGLGNRRLRCRRRRSARPRCGAG